MIFIIWVFSVSYFSYTECFRTLKVYGDVHEHKRFFEETFPWLISNLGGFLKCEFHLLGSGRYSVPQMCALTQLEGNSFLQAEYLKCEASETNPSEVCLCYAGIDPVEYRTCIYTKGWLARNAYNSYFRDFNKLELPLVAFESKIVSGDVEGGDYLEQICDEFTESKKPYGCKNPLPLNNVYRGAVKFDCKKLDNNDRNSKSESSADVTKLNRERRDKKRSSFQKMSPDGLWLRISEALSNLTNII